MRWMPWRRGVGVEGGGGGGAAFAIGPLAGGVAWLRSVVVEHLWLELGTA